VATGTLTREEVPRRLEDADAEILGLGVRRLALFGSVLRNEARPGSDVDFLVEFAPGQKSFDRFLALSEPTSSASTATSAASRSIPRRPAGVGIFRTLAMRSDVLVNNFRVGALARWGFDDPCFDAHAPRLVRCSITGYGPTGPKAELPGYDFVESRASVDPVTEDETPFLGAIKWSRFAGAGRLLRRGANVNSQNSRGMTALHLFLKKNSDRRYFEILLRHGADPTIKNSGGESAGHGEASPGQDLLPSVLHGSGIEVSRIATTTLRKTPRTLQTQVRVLIS